MLRKWLVGLIVCASVLCVRIAAAEKKDFEHDAETKIKDVSQQVQDKMKDMTEKSSRARKSQKGHGHGKGLIKKALSGVDRKTFRGTTASVPNKLDLRANLTQIEDQGSCGSCWAFSLTATHRDGHNSGGKDPGRLSQEWLVDNSPEAQGCGGGYFDSAADFMKPKGQPLWENCAYSEGNGKCAADLKPAAHITGWHMIGDDKGPTAKDIEVYMAGANKPVSITVAAGAGNWEGYSGGIYKDCQTGTEDHMINIVGWDNEGAKFDADGNLPPGKGVWILRNSWGTSWGEGGYMRTKMTDAKGQKCNSVAGEAAFFDFDD